MQSYLLFVSLYTFLLFVLNDTWSTLFPSVYPLRDCKKKS